MLIWCISTYIFIYNRGIGTVYVRNEENKPWSWQIAKHHSILHDSYLFIHFMMVSSSDSRRTGVLNIILYCKCRRSIFVTWRQLNRQVTFIQCSQKVLYSFIFHKNSRRCIFLFNITQKCAVEARFVFNITLIKIWKYQLIWAKLATVMII